jgi:diacylglycerol kinase family enzyme
MSRNAVEVCVIFNPEAARGRAPARLAELRTLMGSRADFRPTRFPGHAEELAHDAAQSGFATVMAAGGDGTVHEVANGLLRSGKREVSLAVYPLGSANDYVFGLGLGPKLPPVFTGPNQTRQVDIGWVKSETGRERYFVNTLGLGFSGSVALESRRIRYLQGLLLYGLAFLRTLCFRYATPSMKIRFDEIVRTVPTLSLTVAIGPREGNLIVARQAKMDDGWFDYLQAGALARWELLRYLPRLASGGQLPTDHPQLWQGRCREVLLQSEASLAVHLDGEFFCLPKQGVHELDIRILPGLLKVRTG